MGYTMNVDQAIGSRIADMTILKTGEKIDSAKTYVVAGWASVNEGTEGPAIWDVISNYLKREKSVMVEENTSVKIQRG
jgi:sulfur-oxidizing protein SoxB